MPITRNRTSALLASSVLGLIIAILFWKYWPHVTAYVVKVQFQFHAMLSDHIRHVKDNPIYYGIILSGLSLAYGVFHAVGPGHGKAVLVTYLSTQNESVRQGIRISFAAAILQSFVAISLVTVVANLLNQTFKVTNQIGLKTEQASYAMVIVFGSLLMIRMLKRIIERRKIKQIKSKKTTQTHRHHQHKHQPHENHDSNNHHQHNTDCCHTYIQESSSDLWQTVGVIFSMGIRPCSGAIVVLMYANIVGVYWVGMLATLLMGIGTGISVSFIGFVTIQFRGLLMKYVNLDKESHYHAGPVWGLLGSLVLIGLGWSLLVASLQLAQSHPLL